MLNPALFDGSRVPPAVAELNLELERKAAGTPLACDGNPAEAKAARARLFVYEPRRKDIEVPGVEGAPPVGLALFSPPEGVKPRGAYLHFHGGGWMVGSAFGQNDARLQRYADKHSMVVVSVEYRLTADGATWPLPVDDGVAAARWLIGAGREKLGTPSLLIGGESSGAHLCLCTLLWLRGELPPGTFRCANLVYGFYDLLGTPSRLAFDRRLVFHRAELEWFAQQLVIIITRRRTN